MKRSSKYVGLDVHQATTVLPTEAEALTEFVRGMRGPVHVALEEGTQAQWVHALLVPVVHRVVVCDRRGSANRGTKVISRRRTSYQITYAVAGSGPRITRAATGGAMVFAA